MLHTAKVTQYRGQFAAQRQTSPKKKSKTINVRVSPQDLDFCCMQQEAGYILWVGEDTPVQIQICSR